jgi:hypothetical protein
VCFDHPLCTGPFDACRFLAHRSPSASSTRFWPSTTPLRERRDPYRSPLRQDQLLCAVSRSSLLAVCPCLSFRFHLRFSGIHGRYEAPLPSELVTAPPTPSATVSNASLGNAFESGGVHGRYDNHTRLFLCSLELCLNLLCVQCSSEPSLPVESRTSLLDKASSSHACSFQEHIINTRQRRVVTREKTSNVSDWPKPRPLGDRGSRLYRRHP